MCLSNQVVAVIYNSDYDFADDCRNAIDRHFRQRNAHCEHYSKKPATKYGAGDRSVRVQRR
jgi:hypothetical protein